MWIAIQNAVGATVTGGGGPTPPPYTPPLDGATDILAAYSVRKLLSTYSGPCMEVHRISDGAKQDIYFDSDGLVNTVDIIAFASGSDLEVSTWYDQGPLSNHAIIDPAVIGQPIIFDVSAGGLQTINGVPAILGGSNRSWNTTTDITTANSIFDVRFTSTVVSISNNFLYGNSSSFDYHSGTNGTNNIYLNPSFSATYVQGGNNYELGVLRDFTTYAYPSRYVILSMLHTSASGRINQLSRDRTQTGRSWTQSWQESIIFGADKTSSRATLESNFNSYYQVTNLPDYTSGFLADYSGAAAAYSVRKLSNTAIKCMRVRRTVAPFDELDIGFTPSGDLDEAAITTFGGSDILVVSRWYDQSGASNHAVQVTPGSQPQIYNGTAVITKNGKPGLSFNFDILNLSSQISFTGSTHIQSVCEYKLGRFLYGGPSGHFLQVEAGAGAGTMNYRGFGADVFGTPTYTANEQSTQTVARDGSDDCRIYYNGTLLDTELNRTATTYLDRIGDGNGSTAGIYDGIFQELIAWQVDQTSNRTAIETNINTYYSVYPTSGLLVDYPGSYRAYSLRKLQNLAQYAIRVQRHSGAFDEQDIGFTPSGDLDTQAIIDFAGTDVVGVKTWYNQVHNGSANDLTQSNTAYQPLIFDGTSVYQSNGKPAIYYDATDKQLADIGATGTGVNTDFFNVHQRNSGTGYFNHWEGSGGFQVARMTTQYVLGWNSGTTGPALDTDQHLFTGIATGTTGQIRLDGTASTPGTIQSGRTFNGKFAIQGRPGFPGNNPGPGDIYHQEFIQYDFNNTGADVTAIENDIKAYYSIP